MIDGMASAVGEVLVTSESLAVQRQAVEAQADHIRMYRGVALIGGVIIAVMIALAVWLILMLI